MKLWVNICFYYVEERLKDFQNLVNHICKIPDINIIVNTNSNCLKSGGNFGIIVSELDDPYHYPWEHKKSMLDFLESDYTHFAYLEGNIEVTPKTFDYWVRTRELFKRNNLNWIPAVHRIQTGKDGSIYSLDPTHRVRHPNIVEVEGQKFVCLPEPYQGMFIMDREMVKEHIESDYFNIGQKGWWGIRESANLGNMFINIPPGYPHRALIPLNNFSDCWVRHFGTDYHGNPNSPHAKIKVEDLFL